MQRTTRSRSTTRRSFVTGSIDGYEEVGGTSDIAAILQDKRGNLFVMSSWHERLRNGRWIKRTYERKRVPSEQWTPAVIRRWEKADSYPIRRRYRLTPITLEKAIRHHIRYTANGDFVRRCLDALKQRKIA